MPELIPPDARLRPLFAVALREFLDEGGGGEGNHSVIDRYLREGAHELDDERHGKLRFWARTAQAG